MGCGESKHAVATANTTVAKSKSKRSECNDNPTVQNAAANESVNVTENEIPVEKNVAETWEDGKKNTVAEQEDIGNGASGEEGIGNTQTPVVAGVDEEEKALNSCDHSHDPPTKNEGGLKLEDQVSTSVGEEESANAISTATDTKAN